MGFNRSIGYMGVAIQTARGTAKTDAKFKFPVYSGGISPTPTLSEDEVSTASRNQGDPTIDAVSVPVEFESRAYVGSLVMFMEAALGARTTTGSTDPYSHALSTGTLPYLTMFESIGASDAVRISAADVKIDTLDLTWEGPKALRLKVSGMGASADLTAADFDATAIDETDGDGYFYPVGGTFEWDAVGSTAAAFTCTGGGLRISNALSEINHCAQITPYDYQEGKLAAAFDLNIVPADLSAWIEVVTGSGTGSAPTGDVQYGKVNLVFQEAGAGTHTLTITASRIPWQITPVTIDAGGGVVELQVTGNARYNATESDALDVTITNANAAATYAAS